MVSCVSEERDRAHLSCAAVPSVSPGPYRRGRWLLLELYEVDLSVVPAVFLVVFFVFPFLWVLSGLPWFLLCSPRRRRGRAPCLFPVSLVFLRGVAGLRGRRWAPSLWVPFVLPVFVVFFAVSVSLVRSGLSFAFYAFVLLLVDF